MDDETEESHQSGLKEYPLWFRSVCVLLWLVGLGVFLLFGFFALVTLPHPSGVGVWNLLVTLAQGFLLFYAARHYSRRTQPMSIPLFWVVVAAVGVPLIASGGCAFFADSFRIAG